MEARSQPGGFAHILILGASYGSLLATKLLMARHNVTVVCRSKTADGTEVRIKLRDEATHRAIFSPDLPGTLDATPSLKVLFCPQMSTFLVMILLVLPCRSRNTPTIRFGF